MCLAVPGRIVRIKGMTARVDIDGVTREVSIMLLPDVKEGDYVLVHAGFAIEHYDEGRARETIEFLKEMADADP